MPRAAYLQDDGEVDHDERGGHHQVLLLDLGLVQQHGETVRHRAPQAAVAHDDLVDVLHRHQPELVQDPGEEEHPCWGPEGERERLDCSGDLWPLTFDLFKAFSVHGRGRN